jgi:hypothetical protein
MGEEKAPGRIQLVSVGMSTVGTAPGGDVFHSVPFTGVYWCRYFKIEKGRDRKWYKSYSAYTGRLKFSNGLFYR